MAPKSAYGWKEVGYGREGKVGQEMARARRQLSVKALC